MDPFLWYIEEQLAWRFTKSEHRTTAIDKLRIISHLFPCQSKLKSKNRKSRKSPGLPSGRWKEKVYPPVERTNPQVGRGVNIHALLTETRVPMPHQKGSLGSHHYDLSKISFLEETDLLGGTLRYWILCGVPIKGMLSML